MKKILALLCLLSVVTQTFALSGQAYMERFNTYWAWNQQLPLHPGPDFIAFIQEPGALSQKLRERWLYELARTKDWPAYAQYYRSSMDMNLVCYYQTALYYSGYQKKVAPTAAELWQTGENSRKLVIICLIYYYKMGVLDRIAM